MYFFQSIVLMYQRLAIDLIFLEEKKNRLSYCETLHTQSTISNNVSVSEIGPRSGMKCRPYFLERDVLLQIPQQSRNAFPGISLADIIFHRASGL